MMINSWILKKKMVPALLRDLSFRNPLKEHWDRFLAIAPSAAASSVLNVFPSSALVNLRKN